MSGVKVGDLQDACAPGSSPAEEQPGSPSLARASDPAVPVPVPDGGEAATLRVRLSKEIHKLSLVQEIGRALGSTLDIDELLAMIMERVSAALDAERSTLYLLSDDGTELRTKVAQGDDVKEIRLRLGEGIAGWVAQSGQTASLPDAYGDPRFQKEIDRRTGFRTRSMLVVPMRNHLGRLIGVLQVLNKRAAPSFTADDEATLHAIAATAAISIENSKLYTSVVTKNAELLEIQSQLQQRTSELNLLFELEREVNGALDVGELLDRILRRAIDLLEAEAGSVLLREGESGELYFRAAHGSAGDQVRRLSLPPGRGIAGWVAEHKQPLLVNEPTSDPRHDRALAEQVGYQARSILCAPLVAGEESLGAIELLNKRGPGRFSAGDEKLLALIAGQASRAIQVTRAKEERLNQSRLASIGQMLSGVLHDLKTPMTIVSGYAQLMAQQEDGEQRHQFTEHILRQLDHMNVMTREVLAFARGESNLLVRKVYLHRFIDEIADHLRHELAPRNVELVLQPEFTGVAHFDESKFLRVVHNLARNAVQAMPHGGTFTVRVESAGKDLLWSFADTGTGIPAEMEGRLFDAFATSGKQDGTGLGLAIVKKIVEDHLGSISYRSKPGQGTTFLIRMPLDVPASAGRSSDRIPAASG